MTAWLRSDILRMASKPGFVLSLFSIFFIKKIALVKQWFKASVKHWFMSIYFHVRVFVAQQYDLNFILWFGNKFKTVRIAADTLTLWTITVKNVQINARNIPYFL